MTADPSSPPGTTQPLPMAPEGVRASYSVEAVRGAQEIANLEGDWNRLATASPHPNAFMTYDWFRVWNQRLAGEHQGGERRPEVLVFRQGGAVAGIAPLVYRVSTRGGFHVRRLESLASPADYCDVSIGGDPAGQIEALVAYLDRTRNQWDLVELRSVRDLEGSRYGMDQALQRAGLPYRILTEERCAYLPIDGEWPEILRRLAQTGRPMEGMGLKTLRLKQHRLERLAAEGLRTRVIENPAAEPGLIEKMIALESQKQLDGKPIPPFLAKYPEVFRALFESLGPRGWLYVVLMELGEHSLAYLLGFRCGKKLWHYQTAYDNAYSRLSPGTMLIPAILDYGLAKGYDEYDFLTGEEAYKLTWGSAWHETFRVQIWSHPWTEWAYRTWEKICRRVRRS